MNLLTYLNTQKENIKEMLRQVVELESPSRNKDAVDGLVQFLQSQFNNIGCRTEKIKQTEVGDLLRVEFGEGHKQVLVLCHVDTVFPMGSLVKQPFRILNGKIYGPGVFDMKGGIVQTYFAIKAIREMKINLNNQITILFNSDEEIGSPHSRELIEYEARRSKCVLVRAC